MQDMKSKVLDEISKWADGMMVDRIKARQSPGSLEMAIQGHGNDMGGDSPESLAAAAESKARDPEPDSDEVSLDDLLGLEKNLDEKC